MRLTLLWAFALVAVVKGGRPTSSSSSGCTDVTVQSRYGEREEETPRNMDVKSVKVIELKADSSYCLYGDTYGFTGNTIWADKRCRGVFQVCSEAETFDLAARHAAETDMAVERRLKDLFGNKPISEIKTNGRRDKKDFYADLCVCNGWGDPHFIGNDGAGIHFQGVCEYMLWRTKGTLSNNCEFDISVENENRDGEMDVSFVKSVNIRIFGQEITLGKDNQVFINGILESEGLDVPDKYSIQISGSEHIVFDATTACGLQVSFEGNHKVQVLLPKDPYAGKLAGLCGNCNGNEADDYMMADGSSPSSTKRNVRNAEIGESWRVDFGRPDLPASCDAPAAPTPESVCEDDAATLAAQASCQLMTDTTGPFKDCLAQLTNFQADFESCTEDQCAFQSNPQRSARLRCEAFEAFAEKCSEIGLEVDWRSAAGGCERTCPDNSRFYEMMPSCQPSCSKKNPGGRCRRIPVAGCLCDVGYLYSNGKCIDEDECGCKRGNRYLERGQTVLSNNCKKKYTCDSGSNLVREDNQCASNEKCGFQDGVRACVPKGPEDEVGTGKTCPTGALYKPALSGCQPSCPGPRGQGVCDKPEFEGCECQDGKVMENGVCIEMEECGCINPRNGNRHPRGGKFYSEDCRKVFNCVAVGALSLVTPADADPQLRNCGNNARCSLNPQGQPRCKCDEGYEGNGQTCTPTPPPANSCFCKATGDPRVLQYDGTWVKVYDPCKYVLSHQQASGHCFFKVEMKNRVNPHAGISLIYEADVHLDGVTVRLGPGLEVRTKTALVSQFQPLTSLAANGDIDVVGPATLEKLPNQIVLTLGCGVTVKFLDSGEIQVDVPKNIATNLGGMCGNCNGDWRDDRVDLSGKRPSDYSDREEGYKHLSRRFVTLDDSSVPDSSEPCTPPA